MGKPAAVETDDVPTLQLVLALTQSVVRELDPRNEIATAARVEIESWYASVKRASISWRWTAADAGDARAMVEKLGYGDLARRLTGREVVVLLALIPQLPSITHHGPSLARAMQRWLAVPVRFIPHVATHSVVPVDDRSLLKGRYSHLGVDMALGAGLFEHGATIGLEADLRADGAMPLVLGNNWVETDGTTTRPTPKLLALTDALVAAALRVDWRFLMPPVEVLPTWRLGEHGRLGISTRLERKGGNADA